jgi:hypothetical protein
LKKVIFKQYDAGKAAVQDREETIALPESKRKERLEGKSLNKALLNSPLVPCHYSQAVLLRG